MSRSRLAAPRPAASVVRVAHTARLAWFGVLIALASFATGPAARADEGMWTPDQLPEISKLLTKAGLELDAQKLADLDQDPMGAVVSLGGCTASFVSPEGLVITNHHCAFGAIQYNSTPERNLIRDGFLARAREEELFAGPGSRVYVTETIRDVTADILRGIGDDIHGKARFDLIEAHEKELVETCERETGVRCRVASFHGGLEYKLVRQLEIRDVRLVYAPAEGIGDFGGEVDNWMWPRHTGDFSFYRAYVGPDGQPADYAPVNVPYRPQHVLKVNPNGVQDGDFVMVIGYPGRTSRYRLAREVEDAATWSYPVNLDRLRTWIDIIEKETRDRPEAGIKLARQRSGLENRLKNNQGMIDGFRQADILQAKRAEEARLQEWIMSTPEYRTRYGNALPRLDGLLDRQNATRERTLHYERYARSSGLLQAATKIVRLAHERQKPDADRRSGYQARDERRIRERLSRLDRTFDAVVDRAVWRRFIADYAAIPTAQHVEDFDRWFGISGITVDEAQLDAQLDAMYAQTELGDAATCVQLMNASVEDLEESDDPFLQLATRLYPSDMKLEADEDELKGLFDEARPQYMEALIAFRKSEGKPVYPDANGTLRVTYGSVRGASPRDGLTYTPFTTVRGVLAKDTGDKPFNSPEALLDAVRAGHFGVYRSAALGTLPVDFLTTLDTTGGNSGSPTLDAHGALVGLAFDGTYESIDADWFFDEGTNRAIHVDIRYVLWIMDQVDGAGFLLDEIGVPHGVATRP